MSHRPGHGAPPPPKTDAAERALSEAGYPSNRHWASNITHRLWHPLDQASQTYISYLGGGGFTPPAAEPGKPSPTGSAGSLLASPPGTPGSSQDMTLYSTEAPGVSISPDQAVGGVGGGPGYYQTVASAFPAAGGYPTGYLNPFQIAQMQAMAGMWGLPPQMAYGAYDLPAGEVTVSAEELAEGEQRKKKKKRTTRDF